MTVSDVIWIKEKEQFIAAIYFDGVYQYGIHIFDKDGINIKS